MTSWVRSRAAQVSLYLPTMVHMVFDHRQRPVLGTEVAGSDTSNGEKTLAELVKELCEYSTQVMRELQIEGLDSVTQQKPWSVLSV